MKALQLRLQAIRLIGAVLLMTMLGCSGGVSDIPSESMAREYVEKLGNRPSIGWCREG